jgi:hypothetical protein
MEISSNSSSVSLVRSEACGYCPEGRTDRLRVVNEREGLVECEWSAAVGCPHAVYFEGRFYCSALVRPEAA